MSRRPRVIEKEFDRKASHYDDYRLSPWYRAQGNVILDALHVRQTLSILDIGCGTGWLLRRIIDKFPAASGIGLDLSGKMIEAAKTKSRDRKYANLTFVRSDWEEIDETALAVIARQNITHIIATSVFHYFSDPQAGSARMFDMLLPGGQLLLMERAKDGSALTWVWDFLHAFLIKDNVRFYHSDTLKRFLLDAGFRDVRIVWRMRRLFWSNKFYTSLVLLSAAKSNEA